MTAPLIDPNPYADLARERKALAIADVLDATGCTWQDAEHLVDAGWQQAATAARQQWPSPEARKRVVVMLLQRAQARTLLAEPEWNTMPAPGCYGCGGTGWVFRANPASKTACSCVTHSIDCEPGICEGHGGSDG